MREAPVEAHLIDRVTQLGGMAIKLHPYIAGLPDRLVLLPGGRILFVELKRPKRGVVAIIQTAIHNQLRKLGFTVLILDTKEKIDEHLR